MKSLPTLALWLFLSVLAQAQPVWRHDRNTWSYDEKLILDVPAGVGAKVDPAQPAFLEIANSKRSAAQLMVVVRSASSLDDANAQVRSLKILCSGLLDENTQWTPAAFGSKAGWVVQTGPGKLGRRAVSCYVGYWRKNGRYGTALSIAERAALPKIAEIFDSFRAK